MKKIMFHDKYGLTRAVLDGRKTQTRRIAGYWDDLDITSKDVKRQKTRRWHMYLLYSRCLI